MNVLGFATGGWIGGAEAFDTGGVCADIGAGVEGGGSVWSCAFLFRLLIFPEATCFGAPLLSDDRAGLFLFQSALRRSRRETTSWVYVLLVRGPMQSAHGPALACWGCASLFRLAMLRV